MIQRKEIVREFFGVGIRSKPVKYLGVPVEWNQSKKDMLRFLKERIVKKIKGWKQKALPLDRKEVLIKVLISAIPSYLMSCFQFVKGWYEVSSLIIKSWWV